jgi:lysophospholipase L1-like esterase
MRRQGLWLKLLIVTNFFSLLFLGIVSLHYDVPQKVWRRLTKTSSQSGAVSFARYYTNTIQSLVYGREGFDTVMLGDSITYGGQWNELLELPNIANLGIPGDSAEGVLGRIADVYLLKPKKCFIMVGINNINAGSPIEMIFRNIETLSAELEKNNIEPVLQSTLYVSKNWPDWERTSNAVLELNTLLEELCRQKGMEFINLNEILSSGGALKEEYTYDGIHLTEAGYKEWAKVIKPLAGNGL